MDVEQKLTNFQLDLSICIASLSVLERYKSPFNKIVFSNGASNLVPLVPIVTLFPELFHFGIQAQHSLTWQRDTILTLESS